MLPRCFRTYYNIFCIFDFAHVRLLQLNYACMCISPRLMDIFASTLSWTDTPRAAVLLVLKASLPSPPRDKSASQIKSAVRKNSARPINPNTALARRLGFFIIFLGDLGKNWVEGPRLVSPVSPTRLNAHSEMACVVWYTFVILVSYLVF